MSSESVDDNEKEELLPFHPARDEATIVIGGGIL
jgi:hypothetical protein